MGWFDWLRRKPPREPAAAEPASPSESTTMPIAPREPARDPAVAAQAHGWVVVLLAEPVPAAPPAFAAWAQRRGLRARTDGALRLVAGDLEVTAYPGGSPFPADALAHVGAPADFEPGAGFLGLSLGAPGARDPWADDGPLRALSRLVLQLLDHGHAIVLPQAGRVFDAGRARARLAGANAAGARPFGGWIAWAVDAELRLYATYGMVLHGLPDVQTTVDPEDPADLDRACAAILFACHHMVWANAPLAADEILVVPAGVAVGAYPIAAAPGPTDRYRVRELPDADRRCLDLQRITASA
jgi:hypothetical protein